MQAYFLKYMPTKLTCCTYSVISVRVILMHNALNITTVKIYINFPRESSDYTESIVTLMHLSINYKL